MALFGSAALGSTLEVERHAPGAVVVGTDGSEFSDAVVGYAATLAAARSRELVIVYGAGSASRRVLDEDTEERAQFLLEHAERVARRTASHAAVSTDLAACSPAKALLQLSRDAHLVVVGKARSERLLALGSTAMSVATHAACPVIVVRTQPGVDQVRRVGPVIVGVDLSSGNELAIAAAFAEASARRAALLAVHACRDSAANRADPLDDEAALAQRIAVWEERYPDVPVTRRVYTDGPRQRLAELSRSAQLVVVGNRGLGGFAGLLLGSTSSAVLARAGCPVMVVRSESPDRDVNS
ncbi:MAG TPA: universal stress protein [Aldersonia sp.]